MDLHLQFVLSAICTWMQFWA